MNEPAVLPLITSLTLSPVNTTINLGGGDTGFVSLFPTRRELWCAFSWVRVMMFERLTLQDFLCVEERETAFDWVSGYAVHLSNMVPRKNIKYDL